ncbi:MAG: hypothetical protein KDI30_00505 [Pseudomonadales bacterium]|nr:hypothetical protein [Pseudomonadales bacterium]
MKLVKILLGLALVSTLLLVAFYFLLQKQTDAILPDLMKASSEVMLKSCDEDVICLAAMKAYFAECREQFLMREATVFSFEQDYKNYLQNTYHCVESKAGIKLADFSVFLQKQKPDE